MRTGNAIEAMEAARGGAKVRWITGRSKSSWLVYEDTGTCCCYKWEHGAIAGFDPSCVMLTWEIDDQPRRGRYDWGCGAGSVLEWHGLHMRKVIETIPLDPVAQIIDALDTRCPEWEKAGPIRFSVYNVAITIERA